MVIEEDPVPVNLVIPNWVTPLAALIPGIPFHCVNPSVFYPLHDANVVGNTVLGP